jgi:hypothetical protein
MEFMNLTLRAILRRAVAGLVAIVVAGLCARSAVGQYWAGYGRDPQHTAVAAGPSQIPTAVRWRTPVDLQPPNANGGDLYIHYGAPAITAANTLVVSQKTGAEGGFRVNAFRAATGQLLWTQVTDYVLPPHNWTPPMGITLTPGDHSVVIPAAGGTVQLRKSPNSASGTLTRVAFYGTPLYQSNPGAFNDAIQICTPITSDVAGNLYFGYLSSGQVLPGYAHGIPSGLARISADGRGSFVSAQALAGDANMQKPVYNCAPAISSDGTKVYIAVNAYSFGSGYLCVASSQSLTPKNSIVLNDPRPGFGAATLPDDGTASPTIGPDGDVYYGVLEGQFVSNYARGWMLHFNSALTKAKLAGAFGWDDSASIVPSSLVASYHGSSSYLILTKYNDYSDPGINGTGANKVAILDPNTSMVDPKSGATVMNEVITILGPTKNQDLPGVDEWCINSAAIDSANKCAVLNSEDGHLYRWDFTTNTLSAGLYTEPPTGEAYTSTTIGPDGAVYAINNAVLFCCDNSKANNTRAPQFRAVSGLAILETFSRFFPLPVQGAICIGVLAAASLHWGTRASRRPRTAAGSFLSG